MVPACSILRPRDWSQFTGAGRKSNVRLPSRGDDPHPKHTRGVFARTPCRVTRRAWSLLALVEARKLLRHLRKHGCLLPREGAEPSLWENPRTGHAEAVPWRSVIADLLAKRMRRERSAPDLLDRV